MRKLLFIGGLSLVSLYCFSCKSTNKMKNDSQVALTNTELLSIQSADMFLGFNNYSAFFKVNVDGFEESCFYNAVGQSVAVSGDNFASNLNSIIHDIPKQVGFFWYSNNSDEFLRACRGEYRTQPFMIDTSLPGIEIFVALQNIVTTSGVRVVYKRLCTLKGIQKDSGIDFKECNDVVALLSHEK